MPQFVIRQIPAFVFPFQVALFQVLHSLAPDKRLEMLFYGLVVSHVLNSKDQTGFVKVLLLNDRLFTACRPLYSAAPCDDFPLVWSMLYFVRGLLMRVNSVSFVLVLTNICRLALSFFPL